MTFRAKPVVNRPHRPSRDSRSRRNTYLNVGFGLAVFLAVVILVGVAGVSYYREHLAAAATVGGQTITIDDYVERGRVEAWRIDQAIARVNAAVAAGRLTSAEAGQQVQSLQAQLGADQLTPLVVEKLIDARIQAGLAAEAGITVTPEQIDAKIVEESTTAEARHAWIIAVAPLVDEGKEEPTDAQKAAAKTIADQALRDITSGGKTWEDVAKAVSTDASKATGGDLGWIDKDAAEDQAFLDAVFAAEQGKPTAVLEGEDGSYVIGRVTEIAAEAVDQAWTTKLTDAGLKIEAYRKVVESEVIRQALEDKAIADATASDKQRQVSEIAIQAPQAPPGDDAIKVRHILYAPKDDPSGAADLPADDPAWTAAQVAATAAYEELKADPTKFDAKARKDSDEASALGDTGSGGKLPYFDTASIETGLDPDFAAAILKPDLVAGPTAGAGQERVRLARHPGDVPPAGRRRDEAAPRPGRWRHGLRCSRPRLLRGPRGGGRRRQGLGGPGPHRRPIPQGDLRHPGRPGDPGHRHQGPRRLPVQGRGRTDPGA